MTCVLFAPPLRLSAWGPRVGPQNDLLITGAAPRLVTTQGFSNGGSMTYKLNCLLSQNFAGMMTIGSAVGTGTAPATCQPQKVLPAINFCGEPTRLPVPQQTERPKNESASSC